ncbi:MAG: hypothetical protein NZT92_06295 [Abditibacteriales bacterium]|nr:hypothetical protein [Abditibacteriales bacterium]MDW8364480.1 hypothetical protein [Abditibacteriales bacterium]
MTPSGVAVPTSSRCVHHPDREGIGVCVRCRQVVCAECATKIDRINYCHRCLATLSAEGRVTAPRRATAEKATAVALLVVSFLVLTGFFVGMGLLMTTLR